MNDPTHSVPKDEKVRIGEQAGEGKRLNNERHKD